MTTHVPSSGPQVPPRTPESDTDVVVAGAGPTALFAALRCARLGHSVVLLSPQQEFEPAGTGISPLLAPPTLGLLAEDGIDTELTEAGQRVLGVDDHGSTGLLSSWRYTDHTDIARPHGLTVPTGTLVQAALAQLHTEPGVRIRTGESILAAQQDHSTVLLTTGPTGDAGRTGHAGGTGDAGDAGAQPAVTGRIRARYAVAAEGRRSALRDLAGIPLEVSPFDRPAWLLVSPAPPDREPVLLVRHHAPNALFTIPVPPASLAVIWSPDQDRAAQLTTDTAGPETAIAQLATVDTELAAWMDTVRDHIPPLIRLDFSLWRATTWRAGRILLLGESAHGLHTLGGQGLNQSLQSSASLARAIHDTLTSGQPHRIEAYERIRRPHIEQLQHAQWNHQALRTYNTTPPKHGAHEDFIEAMTHLQPDLTTQLAAPRP
ncbi:FAD-dependent oxidoreductase [Streptomyces sp. NPDC101165]|uniref:FAD-dependent oxidoreductase n=1 Tax=Streptomyces sp. NPDC101165 TaxID=3366119 RepID=UPI0037F3ABDD